MKLSLFVVLLLTVVYLMKKQIVTTEPRGVLANNPLNIESNVNNNWIGKVTPSVDKRFETFRAPEYGFRAGAILLRDTYQKRYGLETISELIHKFAPSHENESDHYAQFVASQLGVSPHEPINLQSDATLAKMMHAMSVMEVGRFYSLEQAQEGVRMA
ncbi:structural protein [Vibrio anguillarum]|nr:structural protein [Vibrio anguillarum]AUB88971.1 structural protein [Vibrio anguillarum]AUB92411.1 structural protein [Vibrio anguillarum]AUB95846.1 structural protein [Vibrio anguillarum]AUB99267.1 structural protein [Vibrio anguillarum]